MCVHLHSARHLSDKRSSRRPPGRGGEKSLPSANRWVRSTSMKEPQRVVSLPSSRERQVCDWHALHFIQRAGHSAPPTVEEEESGAYRFTESNRRRRFGLRGLFR